MTSLPADSLMDSSYIAQDLITSLARPKNQRQPFKKAPGPSGLRNNLTSSSSATALDMTEVDETLAMDEPSTVRPATRTVNIQHINKQSKLPSKLLPDSLTQGAQTSTNENTRALELEVKSLQEALSAQETQLASKDAEIAQLKDKLAKQAKKTSPPAKTTVPALGDTEFKVLEQQFAQQERLLSGYQKENERATAELQHLRSRNKTMETHLERVYGLDDWESVVFSESNHSPVMAKRTNSSPIVSKARKVFEQSAAPEDLGPPSTAAPEMQIVTAPPSISPFSKLDEKEISGLLAHLESVQQLVQAMDQRLKESDAVLDSKERRVMQAKTDARAMLAAASAP